MLSAASAASSTNLKFELIKTNMSILDAILLDDSAAFDFSLNASFSNIRSVIHSNPNPPQSEIVAPPAVVAESVDDSSKQVKEEKEKEE